MGLWGTYVVCNWFMLVDSISRFLYQVLLSVSRAVGTEIRHNRTCIKSHSLNCRGQSDRKQNPHLSGIKQFQQIIHRF